jgi:hypothetical protein
MSLGTDPPLNAEAPPNSVPAGVPDWVTAELIEHTIRVWQPYYSVPLTPSEAVEIIGNVSRLFRVLSQGK